MIAKEIRCTGKVQGVFFRKYTTITAKQLGLTGTVKNESDGSVSIYAEGEKENLQKLMEWCHTGSPSAEVNKVDVTSSKDIDSRKFNNFDVAY